MFSPTMDNRPDGVYNYELTGCYFAPVPNIPEVYEVCEPVGAPLQVTVNGPDPDSVGTQLGYTFQARVNSTNPAEATAIFIDRTSSATGAGVFQDIVLQKTGNAFQLVAPDSVAGPSPSGWSTVTSVDLVLNDINLDGFVDILVRGLGGSGGPIAGALDQIVYAPGHRGGSRGSLNQPSLHDDLADIDWSQARWSADALDKAHGRLETRRCAAVGLTLAKWDGRCDLHGRAQAVRVVLKTGEATREIAYGLTSLGVAEAGPDELLNIVRRHWEVENRVHYVRDFSYDEDRCRAAAGHLPQNLAALSNAAISIVRVIGHFDYIPQANRHYAARPQDALDAILTPRQP